MFITFFLSLVAVVICAAGVAFGVTWYLRTFGVCEACDARVRYTVTPCHPSGADPLNVRIWKAKYVCRCGQTGETYV